MNYLAHAYLSFEHPQILAGNMISDFVKGKQQFEYDRLIQQGIKLHRAIDQFTDLHPAIKEMKKPFTKKYGRYAGVFTDIACDYFLANDKNQFASAAMLADWSQNIYRKLDEQKNTLPEAFQRMYFFMKEQDWLFNYQFEPMIQKSFAGIVKRAKYMDDANSAFIIFVNNMEKMRICYNDFFPGLKNYAIQTLNMPGKND